ncbi:CPBP family intramembrane glutamic endopeptidase [Micromonospora radicis]|nr:CPBP family intramembrane glutamic endopeptidase [Micromonospora radicis]
MSITSSATPNTTAPATRIPYHRLARTGRHRWWRPVLGTLLIVTGLPVLLAGGFGAVSAVRWAVGWSPDLTGVSATEVELVLTLVALGLLIPLTLLAARWTQRRPAGTVSSVTGRLRWRWLADCLLLAVPVLALSGTLLTLLGEAVESTWVGWERILIGLAAVLVLVPLQAAGEEYLFRGWLMQTFGAWIRSPWPGVVLSSLLFGLAHGHGSVAAMVSTVFFGAVTAVVTIRTGGLEAAIGLHVVNNVVAFGLAVVTGTLETRLASDDMSTVSLAVDMGVVLLYGEAVVWLARRRRVQTHARG